MLKNGTWYPQDWLTEQDKAIVTQHLGNQPTAHPALIGRNPQQDAGRDNIHQQTKGLIAQAWRIPLHMNASTGKLAEAPLQVEDERLTRACRAARRCPKSGSMRG